MELSRCARGSEHQQAIWNFWHSKTHLPLWARPYCDCKPRFDLVQAAPRKCDSVDIRASGDGVGYFSRNGHLFESDIGQWQTDLGFDVSVGMHLEASHEAGKTVFHAPVVLGRHNHGPRPRLPTVSIQSIEERTWSKDRFPSGIVRGAGQDEYDLATGRLGPGGGRDPQAPNHSPNHPADRAPQ
jgi:hypothetical protein